MPKEVKFIKPCSPYNVDEVAQFTDEQADKFIKHEIAVAFEPVKESDEKDTKKTK